MRVDPVWLSQIAARVVLAADVPYQVARRLIREGMDEATAVELATAWRRRGADPADLDRVIRVWRSTEKAPRARRRAARR
ncbi:hypothetical protein [Symbiobacterium thermophilum]|uniref:hypothetical protein n=1 Tax=Symbiobacterium thermophilum TaxID=2734 RepID=UPI00235308B4|nr:hypothetical protein [Symbiobacterium thermophilum]